MRTISSATAITLTQAERMQLETLCRSTKSEVRMRRRARIVLLAAVGTATREISRQLGCTIDTASKWRVRYARHRFAGLSEIGDRGAEPKYGVEHRKRILAMLDQPPPAGYAHWTAKLLARELGDVYEQYIWRFLRLQKIDLSGRKSWCERKHPEFVPKSADIVGLYMSPPDNAVVLSIDEKPSIQALERAQLVGDPVPLLGNVVPPVAIGFERHGRRPSMIEGSPPRQPTPTRPTGGPVQQRDVCPSDEIKAGCTGLISVSSLRNWLTWQCLDQLYLLCNH
jgi:transposase